MSVYTPVTTEELDAWLTRYAVGTLVLQAPIAAGIENTNYFVTTSKGRYVLTLYERLPANARRYLERLQALVDVPIDMISTGPDREQTIVLRHPFGA